MSNNLMKNSPDEVQQDPFAVHWDALTPEEVQQHSNLKKINHAAKTPAQMRVGAVISNDEVQIQDIKDYDGYKNRVVELARIER